MRTDRHTIQVLELPDVLRLFTECAATAPGRFWITSLLPAETREGAERLRSGVEECMACLHEGDPVVLEAFDDLSGIFTRLRPEGAVLEGSDLGRLLPLLRSARAFSRRIRDSHRFPALREIAGEVQDVPLLRKRLERSLLPDGTLADDASPELSRIRKEISTAEGRLQRELERLLRDPSVVPHLQDTYVTRRGDRCVIPVKRSEQGRVRGVLHDLSQSGETAFVEPLETLPLGNELMRLQAEERSEIRRVLMDISRQARDSLDVLRDDFRLLATVDGLAAIGAFANREDWKPCPFRDDGEIRLRNCRHPLLEQRLKKAGTIGELVPLTMSLPPSTLAMVVSGSNTGGKTVILKTVGLMALLSAIGLPLPAGDGTELPWMPYLGAVIGDEQSITDDLSTFSARMMRVVVMLRDAEPGGLAILDELGSGTDPVEGSALACAILEELARKRNRVVASTHLDALKVFAHATPGFVNAAVAFDPATLRPTYELTVGEPGASHAIEIARRVGLAGGVIAKAREYAGTGRDRLEGLIRDLNAMREAAVGERNRLEELRILHEEKLSALAREQTALGQTRMERLREAVREAEALVGSARRSMEELLAGFREDLKGRGRRRAEDEPPGLPRRVRELRKTIDDAGRELRRRREELEPEPHAPLDLDRISPGDRVFVRSLSADGRIETIDRRASKCRVAVGAISAEVPVSDLLPPRDSSPEPGTSPGSAAVSVSPGGPPRSEIVLVGRRVDPALSELDGFLDDALLHGFTGVRIVHGLGTGTLAKAVREFLRDHPGVLDFRPGDQAEGGAAVTVARLR